jgi:F420 biosynthesis protein FbiB-like protein
MQTMDAIQARRSIRKFKDEPVPEEDVREILHAATLAPSGKNRQPWRFVVVRGERRDEMVQVMQEGIEKLKEQGVETGSSEWTMKVMAQAPVTIFIFDPYQANEADWDRDFVDFLGDTVDIQSIGAAIQNMLLAAVDKGLGTLWICDVFYAYPELCNWLDEDHLMVAAVSVGYPDEEPNPRPRKSVDEVTRWFG